MTSILCAGDIHLRHSAPQFRKDVYHETQYGKMQWMLETCESYGAVLCLAGDVFDKKDSPAWHTNKYLDLFLNSSVKVYVVFGNHDQYFHSNENSKTQLGTLIIAGAVTLLNEPVDLGWCVIQGRSWGEAYPEPISGRKNLLIAHETVTAAEPPPWMPDAMSAKKMIEAHPGFGVIVTGDFHEQHITEHNGQYLINTGPMTRDEVPKINFQPKCYMLSEDKMSTFDIPIKDDVFDLDAIELVSAAKTALMSSEQLEAFEQALAQSSEAKPTFRNNVDLLLTTVKSPEVKRLAKEIIGNVSGN